VHLKRSDGSLEICSTGYLAGCDGARSTVREALNIGFPGDTYTHLFYVADVDATGVAANTELHVALDRTDFLAVFPLKRKGHVRLIGTIREEFENQHENLSWNDVSKRVIDWMGIDVAGVNWFSTYRVHHRVAERFRSGRVFLLGDAAHIHSPVGGQGMNTGIGDAVNLAWKLAAVLQQRANRGILDSYEPERIAFARRLVATTDQVFTGVTDAGMTARLFRLRIVPFFMPFVFSFRRLRRFLFRTVSQTAVNYRGSPLSEGRLGKLHGGDRLPWVNTGAGDNFASLKSLSWQVHVYGTAGLEIRAICEQRGLALQIFGWQRQMERCGLQRDTVYLVRPDGYLAVVAAPDQTEALTSYFDKHEIHLADVKSR
jgi:hypothetical protein